MQQEHVATELAREDLRKSVVESTPDGWADDHWSNPRVDQLELDFV
jgi:hypothetical protein